MEILRMTKGNDYKRMLEHLTQLRQRCLNATREGDFRRVAQLTVETARVNAQLQQSEPNPKAQFA